MPWRALFDWMTLAILAADEVHLVGLRWDERGAAELALLLALATAAHPASIAGASDDLARRAIACLVWGVVMATPILLALTLMRRQRGVGALLAATAAGVAGVAALQLHCPITQPAHLAAGHGPGVVILVAAALLLTRRRQGGR